MGNLTFLAEHCEMLQIKNFLCKLFFFRFSFEGLNKNEKGLCTTLFRPKCQYLISFCHLLVNIYTIWVWKH